MLTATPVSPAELNARFPLRFARFLIKSNLTALEITHPAVAATIYLHGAHVASWKPAKQNTDVLWLSAQSHYEPGKPIRGGIPICFPWFGPKADDKTAPAHGTVRIREWAVESLTENGNSVSISLLTRSTDADLALFPHPFQLRHRVTFAHTLTCSLDITNTGEAPATFEEALHTYFAVGDVRDVGIKGLDGALYIDKVDNFTRKTQHGQIAILSETDRPYLNTNATVTITDPGRARMISIEKTNSRSTVVWNPWIAKAAAMPDFGDYEWPQMLCIETANIGENAVTLAPGDTHTMTAKIRVGL